MRLPSLLCFALFLLSAYAAKGQVNYVLNPSFEEYTQCPEQYDEISFANYWNGIDSSWHPGDTSSGPFCLPEYCNVCSIQGFCNIPASAEYYQYPRTGNGFAMTKMFYTENPPAPGRDYIQGHLKNTLIAGQSYCVTFFVNLTEISEYACNHIGAYLDNGMIDTASSVNCGYPQTEYIPQILETAIINDTTNWVRVEGNFIANGTERFITIGNFHSKANTQYTHLTYASDPIAAYLVDDVSVIPSDLPAFAGHDTTITIGDSVFLGRTDLMPDVKWYVLGSSTIIDSNAGLWVKPDTTTSYVVQQTLCGLTTYDTVTIYAYPEAVNSLSINRNCVVYPNPANNLVNITHLQPGTQITIVNLLGQPVLPQQHTTTTKKEIDIHTLPAGTYYIELNYRGQRVVRKLTITR